MIAVVDDKQAVREAVLRVLRLYGFHARGFASGEDFLKSWQADPPECVVLDLSMPGLSGMQVQQALKTAGADFPVIIVSAYDAPGVREQCMRQGAVAFLRKPLDSCALLRTIEQLGGKGGDELSMTR